MKHQKIFPRHYLFNFLTTFLLITVITFSGYKIWQTFNKPVNFEDFPCPGTVISTCGIVQNKHTNEKDWHITDKIYGLKNGDKVRTDSFSEITVTFNNGSEILKAHQNSVFELHKVQDRTYIIFNQGTITLETSDSKSDKIYVIAGDKKIQTKKDTKLLISEESDFIYKIILTVEKGTAKVCDADTENPFSQPAFYLPSPEFNAGENIILKKSAGR